MTFKDSGFNYIDQGDYYHSSKYPYQCFCLNQSTHNSLFQLDGFDPRGNIKVLMATNRPDTLDPALLRPGRLDRKVEFGLPDQEGRINIFRIHARSMSVERDIRYELLARLCPNSTGAEIRSVCTEAGMFAIRYTLWQTSTAIS